MHILDLPTDMINEIARVLHNYDDLIHFILSCKEIKSRVSRYTIRKFISVRKRVEVCKGIKKITFENYTIFDARQCASTFKFNRSLESRKDGLLHSIFDRPAILHISGDKFWYRDGKIHRDWRLGPAIIVGYAGESILEYDSFSVKDAPIREAVGWSMRYECWVEDGRLHRGDDLPAVITNTGVKKWYQHGVLRRNIGPAVINEYM